MKKYLFVLLAALPLVYSCKKKAVDPDEVPSTNTVSIEFEHLFGADALELNSANYYIADNDDSLKFTTLRYYISNIRLKKSGGGYWTQSNSYYLIDKSVPSSTIIEIPEVPAGD